MSRYHCTFKNFIMRQQKRLKHLYQEIETSMCAGLSLAQPSDDISARGLRADRLPCDDEAKSKKKYRESNQSCPGYQPGRPQGLLSRPCPLCALGPSLLHLWPPFGHPLPLLFSWSSSYLITTWKCCGGHSVTGVTSYRLDDVRISNILVSFSEF